MKKIGKYIICGLLGKGGMSVVYKARLPFIDKTVALKLLSPHPHLVSLLGREAVRERFISEALTIASLRSPHIVKIHDFDFHEEQPFFTMEYYYRDLGRLIGEAYRPDLPSRILSLDKTIHYARQLLAGLARLARAGIIHRDIKPGNLMISDEDRIKICDFGFSRVRGEKLDRPPHLLIGSPFYAAPEQERNPDLVDARADLYSAGVIVHRMLTGLLPDGGTQKPSRYHPDAGPAWDRFVEKAIAPEPGGRFASADEMLARLEELAAAWRSKKEKFCRALGETPGSPKGTARRTIRSTPVKVRAGDAPQLFGCDNLMRPLRYPEGDLATAADGSIVLDRSTGLAWQASGTADPLDWESARRHIQHLNAVEFGGCARWRLPTIEELLSITRPPGLSVQDCISPAFDGRQKVLWSCDRCTFTSAWYLDVELGFAGCADLTCHFHARAVTEAATIGRDAPDPRPFSAP